MPIDPPTDHPLDDVPPPIDRDPPDNDADEIAMANWRRARVRRRGLLAALVALSVISVGMLWWTFHRGAPSPSDDATAGDDDTANDDGEAAAPDTGAPPALVDVGDLPPTVSMEGAVVAPDGMTGGFVIDGAPRRLWKVVLADGRHTYCVIGGGTPLECLDRAYTAEHWEEGAPQTIAVQEAPPEETGAVSETTAPAAATPSAAPPTPTTGS